MLLGVRSRGAGSTDRKGALQSLDRCKSSLGHVQSLLCDSGYTGEPFAEGVREILGKQVTVQIAKRSELHTFKVMPKRWIVERRFAWHQPFQQMAGNGALFLRQLAHRLELTLQIVTALLYQRDRLGSIRGVADAQSRQVQGSLGYTAYGQADQVDGTLPDKRCAGMLFHEPSGLYLTQ